MGQSPEELKDEIESTRADLGDTLEAIGDRVSPGRVIERRTARVRQGFADLLGVEQATIGLTTSTTEGCNPATEANGVKFVSKRRASSCGTNVAAARSYSRCDR